MKVKVSQICPALFDPMNYTAQARILDWVAFPFCRASSQPRDQTQVFPTQGSNPSLLHFRWILYQMSHKGSPRILEWVTYPFFRGSSQSRNWTGVSCIDVTPTNTTGHQWNPFLFKELWHVIDSLLFNSERSFWRFISCCLSWHKYKQVSCKTV